MQPQKSAINKMQAAFELAAPANDFRFLKLSGRSKEWADIVKVFKKLLEIKKENSEFFDSFNQKQKPALNTNFDDLANRAGIDKGLALLVLRTVVLNGLRETAQAVGLDSEQIKLPITKALRSVVNAVNPKMESEGLAQALSEIHECVKALDWVDQMQDWFKNPYGKRIPEADLLLSYTQACRVIPWFEGLEFSMRARTKDFVKQTGYEGDLTNLKYQISSELDSTGKIILSLRYRQEFDGKNEVKNLLFARYVIGYAKDGSSTNGIINQREITQARSLLKREHTLTALNKKIKFPRPKCFASNILPALLGGVFDLDAFEKPLKLRVIRNNKQEGKPITTVFVQLVELPEAKRSTIILPKNSSWNSGARHARVILGSSAIRTFISSGTFVGAKFGISLLDEDQQPLKSGIVGDSVCVKWAAKDAPEFKFSATDTNLSNPGQVKLWNEWAEQWISGKIKAMPARIRQVSLEPVSILPNCSHFEFRRLSVLADARFLNKKVYMVPFKTKELGRIIIGISEDKELAFALQGIKAKSGSSIRPLDLNENGSTLRSFVKIITENMWNYFPA